MALPSEIKLTPGKRVLFLTKDLDLIKRQLYEGLNLRMADLRVEDLLDDINTDTMTPAWVCFSHKPEDIALDAYAGLFDKNGERVFKHRALLDGNFEVIVSGLRKGTGSSRETAPQCEKWSGIRLVIAASFAPIHERNNINLGQLMGDHEQLKRLQAGETLKLSEFTGKYDAVTRAMLEAGGLFPFSAKVAKGEIKPPKHTTQRRGMTMAEKLIATHLVAGQGEPFVKPGDAVLVNVDAGYSHEFTTAQVHYFLEQEYGKNYAVKNPGKFAVFEDHLLYATGVKRFAPFEGKIQTLRDLQREFQRHTGVRDYSARNGVSPGICHQVAREHFVDPGDFVQATDSHTCMGGGNNALSYGVGATEYAGLIYSGFTFVAVPESIRFQLKGKLQPGVTAKDVMLFILDTYAKREQTLDRVMEFGGPGLATISMDERATLCNMATECSAKSGICEADDVTWAWFRQTRKLTDAQLSRLKERAVAPDRDAAYDGGVHEIDLSSIKPMVAKPGDPTYGELIENLGEVKIDIAYGGSCTAGKVDDLDYYATVLREAIDAGRQVAKGVKMYLQYGSEDVMAYARSKGYPEIFAKAGVEVINPGCGACIGCGPGVSETKEQVTVSAINRNFPGRSGPGKLYLASPLTVAASAIEGRIVNYKKGMFKRG
ncbi:MAG: 3-isopropylmalate dehydratase large subunit [Planctomycetes bacterium]|nr:3-isopropylmalate dehydratase large subunit [Planctomycetota bacterium]HRJ77675.1 aconitase family protein [Planctomycetota bacterium]